MIILNNWLLISIDILFFHYFCIFTCNISRIFRAFIFNELVTTDWPIHWLSCIIVEMLCYGDTIPTQLLYNSQQSNSSNFSWWYSMHMQCSWSLLLMSLIFVHLLFLDLEVSIKMRKKQALYFHLSPNSWYYNAQWVPLKSNHWKARLLWTNNSVNTNNYTTIKKTNVK